MKLPRVSFQNFIVPMTAAAAAPPESAYKRVPPRHISYQSYSLSFQLSSVVEPWLRARAGSSVKVATIFFFFFFFIYSRTIHGRIRRRNASNQRQRASYVRVAFATSAISHGNYEVDGGWQDRKI